MVPNTQTDVEGISLAAQELKIATGWTVRRRLAVSFIAVALSVVMLAISSFVATIFVASGFEQVAEDILIEVDTLGEIGQAGEVILAETREYALFGDNESLERIEQTRRDLQEAVTAFAATKRKGEETEKAGEVLENIQQALANLQDKSAAMITLVDQGGEGQELEAVGEELEAAEQILTVALAEARDVSIEESQEVVGAVEAAIYRVRILFVILPLGILFLVFGLTYLLNRSITSRLQDLTGIAQAIADGDLNRKAKIDSADEISLLAKSFNYMTAQLSHIIATLEERVGERTRQLETVVEISQDLTGILDLSDLLRQVVTITKKTFNYYHVHIYLLEGDRLVMAEGYGQAGIEMKRQDHTIPLVAFKSLVARAAREGQAIIVEDVRAETGWLPNPLLPETRSEMAVPINLGTEVVGVLDVQSEKVSGLTEEDKATLKTLANYIATAVRSARLFSQTQEALYEAQRLQQLYTGQAWEKLAASPGTMNYEFRRTALPPLSDISTPEVETALRQSQTVDLRLPAGGPNDGNGVEGGGSNRQHHNALATPLKLRGQTIGILGIHDNNPERRWTEDEIALIEAVSEQMSLALENARLFEETGRRATREKIIADMTQQVWASGDLEKVMQTAVEQLGVVLDASKVVIRLGTKEQLSQPLSPHEVDVGTQG